MYVAGTSVFFQHLQKLVLKRPLLTTKAKDPEIQKTHRPCQYFIVMRSFILLMHTMLVNTTLFLIVAQALSFPCLVDQIPPDDGSLQLSRSKWFESVHLRKSNSVLEGFRELSPTELIVHEPVVNSTKKGSGSMNVVDNFECNTVDELVIEERRLEEDQIEDNGVGDGLLDLIYWHCARRLFI